MSRTDDLGYCLVRVGSLLIPALFACAGLALLYGLSRAPRIFAIPILAFSLIGGALCIAAGLPDGDDVTAQLAWSNAPAQVLVAILFFKGFACFGIPLALYLGAAEFLYRRFRARRRRIKRELQT